MAVLRFDTWKHSEYYGLDLYWSNRWYLYTPRAIADTWFDMQYLIQFESKMHYNHVRYSHVTVVNPYDLTDAAIWAANNWDPYNPEWRGQVGVISTPAPYEYVKRVRKYPIIGRSGFMWFRGGLDNSELLPSTEHAHAGCWNMNQWRTVATEWPAYFASIGVTVMIGYGANQFGHPTTFESVNAMRCEGITIAKAAKRAQANLTGKGPDLYATIHPQLKTFRDWAFEVGTWWNTGSNAVPVSVKQNTITMLGYLKAFLGELKSFADDITGGDSETAQPANFRWAPDADTVATFADTTKEQIINDVIAIEQIVPYSPDGVNYYITHANTDDILNKIIKYMAVYSQVSLIDYRNPANSH